MFADAQNAAIAPQPQVISVVFQDLRNGIIQEAVSFGKCADFPLTPATEARRGAYPQRAVGVLVQRANEMRRQAVLAREPGLVIVKNSQDAQTVARGQNPVRVLRLNPVSRCNASSSP